MAGTIVTDTIQSGVSTPTVFKNTSGTEIGQFSRAWISFNGVSGSVAINASFNCTSLSRINTGAYNFNFVVSMSDNNYSCPGNCDYSGTANVFYQGGSKQRGNTTSLVYSQTTNNSGSASDASQINATVFR